MQRRTLRLFWCACACLASLAACSSDPIGTGGASGSSSSGGGGATSTTISTTSTGSTISTGGGEPLPDVFTVTGVVVDALDGATPIEGAIVMQAGGEPALTTGPDGTFTIELSKAIPGTPTVVATKLGFRTKGMDFFELPGGPIKLDHTFEGDRGVLILLVPTTGAEAFRTGLVERGYRPALRTLG